MTKQLSLIIPCYNEEAVIEHTAKRVAACNLEDCEVVFINDGSTDSTLEKLKTLAAANNNIKIIDFSRNFGHQAAVSAGLHACTGNMAAILDADLQDPPELIFQMLTLMQKEKCNVVYGVRKSRKGESIFKKTTAKLFYRLINKMSEVPFPLDTGDFRLIDRKVINEFKKLKEKNKYIRGLISWVGFKQAPFYYERETRFAGETKYPLSKMISFAFTGILYFTKKPLKLAVALGSASVLLSLLMSVWVLFIKFFEPQRAVPGWASLLLAIIFMGGVQLLTLGILAEYTGSIFDEVKDRPEYIINETINF